MSAERRHGIDDDQRAMLVHDRRDILHGIENARGGFGMNAGDQIELAGGESLAYRGGIDGAAPFDIEAGHRAAVAPAHLREPVAEIAGDDRQHRRLVAHEIGDEGFHARGARAGDGEGEGRLGCAENLAEP
ncbi:hypothetical protein D3C83_23340 [compost metagenome]